MRISEICTIYNKYHFQKKHLDNNNVREFIFYLLFLIIALSKYFYFVSSQFLKIRYPCCFRTNQFKHIEYLAIFENTTREGNLPLAPRDLTIPPPSRAIVIVIAVYSAAIKLQWNHPCALRTIAKCLIGQTISDKACDPVMHETNFTCAFPRVIHAAGKMSVINNFKFNIF